jgi:hypothetical protein
VETITGALRSEGPLPRNELRVRLDDAGVRTEGQALVFLLAAASVRGLIVRGPVVDGRHAFVSVDDWLGPSEVPLGRQEALGRLALRYLAGHEPASPHDLAKWAGITLADARLGFGELDGQLHPLDDGIIRRSTDLSCSDSLPTRLLGAFDPILHGWASREVWVGGHRDVVTTNGIFRPVCLVDGRVVATWRMPAGAVDIDLLQHIDDRTVAALREDAGDVCRFLGHGGAPPHTTVHPATR